MANKSVMSHKFSQIPRAEIPRSSFDRSHGYKTTFDAGDLVPFFVDEALPGDTFNLRATLFGRLATPIVPIMDNMFMDTFYFAVPLRLLWDNWQKFNGEQVDPGDSTDYLIPHTTSPAGGWTQGTLSDYMGLPTGIAGLEVSSLWHRAYNLIYNEWFRDENLQDSLDVPKGDGPDASTLFKIKKRGKRHDYFTSCLPWPQKGPGVELPVGGLATVTGSIIGSTHGLTFTDGTTQSQLNQTPTTLAVKMVKDQNYNVGSGGNLGGLGADSKILGLSTDKTRSGIILSEAVADLSTATGVTINSMRQAFQLQKLYERDARGGTRYTEILRAHFGVVSPDARLQRPEYLGGSSVRININPVPQTAPTTGTSPQGNLAGYGTVSDGSGGFSKSFVEHSVIIGIVNVRADLTYQQGLHKKFTRKTRFDFYWPALAHLGEQAVLNKEIYTQGTPADDQVFGYQERWSEYRYFPSIITGQFRSQYAQSLDLWHLSQEFGSLPTLSGQFIEDNPPIDRVIAVPSEPHILLDTYISLHCARPMPIYSVPGLIDHF